MNNRKYLLYLPGGLIVALALGFLLFPFNNGSAADDEKTSKSDINTPQSGKQGPPNFDVLAERPARSSSNQNRVQNGRVRQIEPRFDVPTFFWAADPGVPQAFSGDSLQRKNTQTDVARNHLGRFAAQF